MDYHQKHILIMLLLAILGACAEEDTPNQFNATVNGKSVEFGEPTISVKSSTDDVQIIAKAHQGQEQALIVTIQMSPDGWTTGESSIDGIVTIENGTVEYTASESQTSGVIKAWVGYACQSCDNVTQTLKGTVRLDTIQGDLAGTVSLSVDGGVHGWNEISATIDVVFDIPLDTSVTFDETDPRQNRQNSTGSTSHTSKTDPESKTDNPPKNRQDIHIPGAPIVSAPMTITLQEDDGVDFEKNQVLTESFFKSDLYATQGNPMKLTPGGPKPTQSNPVHWFKSEHGFYRSFDSLKSVPLEYPEWEAGTSLINPEKGLAFVVKNNLSDGYTKGWISGISPDGITIEYVVIN